MTNAIKTDFEKQMEKCKSLKELDFVRQVFLGRKEGKLNLLLRDIKNLPDGEKKTVGQEANLIRGFIEKEIEEKERQLKSEILKQELGKEWIDATQPVLNRREIGHLHPLTQLQNEIEDIFISMGFMILDGPELESEYYNFEALNIPSWHPAREMQDTFYVQETRNKKQETKEISNESERLNRLLMRTHTSPVQVRAMEQYGAPIKAIIPGRCFRHEATDIRHEHTFNQLEGIMIDKNISISNMMAVLEAFAKALFGKDTKMRLRPKFYPFVEPGANGEITCSICGRKGCRLCKYTGWLEVFGCGLIHPNVLKYGGIDPGEYSGFAFGFGFSRVAQLKYGVEDVRLFNSGDLRFLRQF